MFDTGQTHIVLPDLIHKFFAVIKRKYPVRDGDTERPFRNANSLLITTKSAINVA